MLSRRLLLTGALLAASDLPAVAGSPEDGLADLERKHGGRLGVAILDTGTMRRTAHRGDELFPLCSTYKCLAAAYVLARVDRGQESLSRRIAYAKSDLVAYSPVTGKHVGGDGMTLAELCEAAVTLSDNTAGNLLLDSFGGPAALTAYFRSLGDEVTRLDRREPALNDVDPGDPRDSTTPAAMAGLMRAVVVGTALSAGSRAQLVAWLVGNKTGGKRLRAGVPAGWRLGDKTGSGPKGITNDVAILWPPGRAPIIVTAFYVSLSASMLDREAVLADVGRIAAAA
jgi:beta-lactamase class A